MLGVHRNLKKSGATMCQAGQTEVDLDSKREGKNVERILRVQQQPYRNRSCSGEIRQIEFIYTKLYFFNPETLCFRVFYMKYISLRHLLI